MNIKPSSSAEVPTKLYEVCGLTYAAAFAVLLIMSIARAALLGMQDQYISLVVAVGPMVVLGLLFWWLMRVRRYKAEQRREEYYEALRNG